MERQSELSTDMMEKRPSDVQKMPPESLTKKMLNF